MNNIANEFQNMAQGYGCEELSNSENVKRMVEEMTKELPRELTKKEAKALTEDERKARNKEIHRIVIHIAEELADMSGTEMYARLMFVSSIKNGEVAEEYRAGAEHEEAIDQAEALCMSRLIRTKTETRQLNKIHKQAAKDIAAGINIDFYWKQETPCSLN